MTEFTVVMATRNRPVLVRAAIGSVLQQRDADFDIVVVNDGTEDAHRPALDALRAELAGDGRVGFIDLPASASGHGPYFTLNTGARAATGRYVCFLDDDDIWTDPDHLAAASRIVAASALPPDLIFFDQEAVDESGPVAGPIWLEDLGARLRAGGPPGPAGAYSVDVPALLTARGFCHLNTTIARRAFFLADGGFDGTLRWEGDREFFLRGVDTAACIQYAPDRIARHHVPRPAAANNVTTRMSWSAKRFEQFHLLDKVARSARHREIVAYAKRHRRYAFLRAAREAVSARSLTMVLQCLRRAPRLIG